MNKKIDNKLGPVGFMLIVYGTITGALVLTNVLFSLLPNSSEKDNKSTFVPAPRPEVLDLKNHDSLRFSR